MRTIKAASAAAFFGVAFGGWKSSEHYSAKPAAVPVVTFVAKDFAFAPIADVPAGVVELRVHNEGTTAHHAAIFKLDAGRTVDDLIAAMKKPGPFPRWATPMPGPNAPVPGEYGNVTTRLAPGNYAVLCFVHASGNGTPHFMRGMYRSFKVVPSKNRAIAPATDVTITTFDYGFKISKELTAGHHSVKVVSAGVQPHEVALVKLAPGKSVLDFGRGFLPWTEGDRKTPAPGEPMGGVVGILPGEHASFDVTFTRGNWGLLCFWPDSKDGKPHFMHGMFTQFAIK